MVRGKRKSRFELPFRSQEIALSKSERYANKSSEAFVNASENEQVPVPIEVVCENLRAIHGTTDPMAYFENQSADFWTVVWLLAHRYAHPVADQFLDMQSEVLAA